MLCCEPNIVPYTETAQVHNLLIGVYIYIENKFEKINERKEIDVHACVYSVALTHFCKSSHIKGASLYPLLRNPSTATFYTVGCIKVNIISFKYRRWL